MTRYKDQLLELTQNATRIEENIRREFKAQLEELLEERQQEWANEKEQGIAGLKAEYNEKVGGRPLCFAALLCCALRCAPG